MGFTTEQLSTARTVNLAEFLVNTYPNEYRRVGGYVYAVNEDTNKIITSMPLRWGFGGFHDFSNDKSGNAVEFLMEYHDLRFYDAVTKLLQYSNDADETQEHEPLNFNNLYELGDDETEEFTSRDFEIPEPYSKGNKHLFAHMTKTRCIDAKLVQWLIDCKLLYETLVSTPDRAFFNMVFINKDRTRIEIKETHSTEKYKRTKRLKVSDFWSMGSGDKIYVCESALDAVSLYDLKREQAIYASMSTCLNYHILNRLIQTGKQICIAVDNDPAGEKVRNKLQGCGFDFIIPKNKDWTDDLIERESGRK